MPQPVASRLSALVLAAFAATGTSLAARAQGAAVAPPTPAGAVLSPLVLPDSFANQETGLFTLPAPLAAIASPSVPTFANWFDTLHASVSGVALYGYTPATKSTSSGSFSVTGAKAQVGWDAAGIEAGYTRTDILNGPKVTVDISATIKQLVPTSVFVRIGALAALPATDRAIISNGLNFLATLPSQYAGASPLAAQLSGPVGGTATNLQTTLDASATRLGAGVAMTTASAAAAGATTPFGTLLGKAAQGQAALNALSVPAGQNSVWLQQTVAGTGFSTLGAAIYDVPQAAALQATAAQASRLLGTVGLLTGDASKIIGIATADGKDLAAIQSGLTAIVKNPANAAAQRAASGLLAQMPSLQSTGANISQFAGQVRQAAAGDARSFGQVAGATQRYVNGLRLLDLVKDAKPLLGLIPADVLASKNPQAIATAVIAAMQNVGTNVKDGAAAKAFAKLAGVDQLNPAALKSLAEIVKNGGVTVDLTNYRNELLSKYSILTFKTYAHLEAVPVGFYAASPELHVLGATVPQGLIDGTFSAGPVWGRFGVRGSIPAITGSTIADFGHYGQAAIPQVNLIAGDQHATYIGAQFNPAINFHVLKAVAAFTDLSPVLKGFDISLTAGAQLDLLHQFGGVHTTNLPAGELPKRIMFGGGTIGGSVTARFSSGDLLTKLNR